MSLRFGVVVFALCSLVGCYRSHQREPDGGPDANLPRVDAGRDSEVDVDAGSPLECYPTARVLEFRGECVGFEVMGGDEYECAPASATESLPRGRAVAIVNATDLDARLTFFIYGAGECSAGPWCWGFMGSPWGGDPCSCGPITLSDGPPVASNTVDSPLPPGETRTLLFPNGAARYHVAACPPRRD